MRKTLQPQDLIHAERTYAFKGFSLRKAVAFLFLFFSFFFNSYGQNRVTFSSSSEPGPTSLNLIPLNITFEGPVDAISISDFNINNGELENLIRSDVNFVFQDSKKILDFTFDRELDLSDFFQIDRIIEEELGDAVISIDFNSQNELFYLTLKNGIYKYGNSQPVIDANEFDTPLDMVINRQNGNIIVADSEAGKVFIFDSSYKLIKTIGTGSNANSKNPRGATGLALDEEGNIYVADNFTGNTPDQDAIKIYSAQGDYIKTISTYNGEQIEDPFRIAVDKDKNIYLSESGGEQRDPRIIIFDRNYNPSGIIQGGEQGTPGSLIVDKYGYLYVIDYKDDFNLTDLFNDPLEVLNNYETIRDTKYTVNVFNTNTNFDFIKKFNNTELNLPIDLALDNCGLININNLKISGSIRYGEIPINIDSKFDFTLETFQREDSFTANLIPEDPGLVEVIIKDVDLFKCEPQPEGFFEIEYQPGDLSPEANCKPATIFLDQNGMGILSATAVYDGNAEADNVNLSLSQTNFNCEDIGSDNEVTLTVTDREDSSLFASCTAIITVTDTIVPVITCPKNIIDTVAFGESGKVVKYAQPAFSDNCENTTLTQTSGLASGARFPVGTTTNTFRVSDYSGNSLECSFTVIIREEQKDIAPVFQNCPPVDIETKNDPGECGAVVTFNKPKATDENGEVGVVRTDNNDLNSGDMFPVGETTITFEADDGTHKPVTCSFKIIVTDAENPTITCPKNIIDTVAFGESGKVVKYAQPAFSDNCENTTLTQTSGLASGARFPVGRTLNTFVVEDENGHTASCSFEVVINENDDVEDPVFQNCPSSIIRKNNPGECGGIVVFKKPSAIDNSGSVSITQTAGLESGNQFPVGNTTVTFEATDGAGNTATCSFTVIVEDEEAPVISCPKNITKTYDPNTGYQIPDFTNQIQVTDNCTGSEDLIITQRPAAGVTVYQNQEIKLRVEDVSGNFTECSFQLTLQQQDVFNIECIGSYTAKLGYNSNTVQVPTKDLVIGNTSGMEFEIKTQQFDCADIGTQNIRINATKTATGETASCTVAITVVDTGKPLIVCPAEVQQREIPESGIYVLPEVVDLFGIADNCSPDEDLVVVQDPPVGTEYTQPGDYTISITATDPYNNTETCNVIYRLSKTSQPSFECPESNDFKFIPLDEDCNYKVPDYTGSIQNPQNFQDLRVLQKNDKQEDFVTVTLEVYDGNEFIADCIFSVFTTDVTAPKILNCSDFGTEISLGAGETYTIKDYTNLLEVATCGNFQVSQNPEPGTPVNETTNVSLVVTDEAGNINECSFRIIINNEQPPETPNFECKEEIQLNLDENGQASLSAQDLYSGSAPGVDFSLSKTNFTCGDLGENEVLLNYSGAVEGSCSLRVRVVDNLPPQVSCVQELELSLDASGTLRLQAEDIDAGSSDNCGIVSYSLNKTEFSTADLGENTILLTVEDAAGNTASCSTALLLEAYSETPNFECKEEVQLNLDENGQASLSAQDLYSGSAPGVDFSLSKTNFTCGDLGENEVLLNYSGAVEGSCSLRVRVVDNLPPQISVQNINLELDENGKVIITAQMLQRILLSANDNCSNDLDFQLSRTTFNCKDIGLNTIQLSARDKSGNQTTASMEVNITAEPGICSDIPPVEENESLFIYPNPSPGNFKIATPRDMEISKVYIFDSRGRFISEKIFRKSQLEYFISLNASLQESVYTLQIFTNKGEFIRRLIIKK